MEKKKTKNGGKSTTVAQDVMSSTLVVIRKEDNFRAAVELLTQKKVTILPVVDQEGKLTGLLTEQDVLRACDNFDGTIPDFLDRPIKYSDRVKTVTLDTPIEEIGAILANEPYRHLPVVDQNFVLKGIITRRDLIRVIYLRIELNKGLPL